MPNQAGRLFTAVSNGAEIKAIKGVGFIVIDKGQKRTRRTKEEIKASSK